MVNTRNKVSKSKKCAAIARAEKLEKRERLKQIMENVRAAKDTKRKRVESSSSSKSANANDRDRDQSDSAKFFLHISLFCNRFILF